MGKETVDQLKLLSQPPYGQLEFQVQLRQSHTRHVAHLHVLQV